MMKNQVSVAGTLIVQQNRQRRCCSISILVLNDVAIDECLRGGSVFVRKTVSF